MIYTLSRMLPRQLELVTRDGPWDPGVMLVALAFSLLRILVQLEMLGLRDSPPEATLWLVEWPERAAGTLPAIDLAIRLTLRGAGRSAELAARQNGSLEQTLQSLHE